ncbi:MAG: alpha/beta hydrolase [Betaproteobacteria bacterium]|nr:alpha/beta hydrolase [Betaproteobacteria bacterium]
MPKLQITPDCAMNYIVDDYTDPWGSAEAILLLHGIAESSAVWFGWIPHLARRLRVVRPDMRGYGASTAMPRDFPWSLDVVIDDFMILMQALGIERFHLVGAKIGGMIARRFAARHPTHVRTLTLVGTPAPHRDRQTVARMSAPAEELEKHGIEPWARRTMSARLGSRFPPEGVEWWIKLMARTPLSTQIGFVPPITSADISLDLPRIACPTLVITTQAGALGSVDETRAWQEQIPRSSLLVLPGDSYHVAASDPDRCARETFDFIAAAHA